jgi:hypothetical protein
LFRLNDHKGLLAQSSSRVMLALVGGIVRLKAMG